MRLVLGISGGIAAYKMPDLVRMLRRRGVDVRVVLTHAAGRLVAQEALAVVSGAAVYTDHAPASYDMDHIQLAQWGDVLCICPATANTLAKISCGIADNLLTTLALSFQDRLHVAPAMNTAMWENRVTQGVVERLRAQGVGVWPVDTGELACGTSGAGRLLPLDELADRICGLGRREGPLAGKRLLIASGPTAEALDPVRVLTNRSSGRMGRALARVAWELGGAVTVISGPAPVAPPSWVEVVKVTSAAEMSSHLHARFDACDICIMAAAVSDYRVQTPSPEKIQRSGATPLVLELVPNEDIARSLGERKKGQLLVCFALEGGPDSERARRKCREKHADLIVLNHIDTALEGETTAATLLDAGGGDPVEICGSKERVARGILERIAAMAGKHHG